MAQRVNYLGVTKLKEIVPGTQLKAFVAVATAF